MDRFRPMNGMVVEEHKDCVLAVQIGRFKSIYDQEMISQIFTSCYSTNINHQMALERQ